MNPKKSGTNDEVIARMTQVVLTEILEQVVNEFEKRTGTRIGRIRIAEPNRFSGRRPSEIEVRCTGRDCLNGLMQYKQILCEHSMFSHSRFCQTEGEN